MGRSEGVTGFNQAAFPLQAANQAGKTLQQPGLAVVTSPEQVTIYFTPHFQTTHQHQCFEMIFNERAAGFAALFIIGPEGVYLLAQEKITPS